MPQHTITKQTPRKLLRNTETKQPQGQYWRYGVWIQLRRLEMSREASWCWVRANCPSAYPPNLWTNGWKTFHPWPKHRQLPVPSWLSAASLFVLYKKKLDQSQCVFSDPAHQQRNVLIPKLGQGILAVSAPRELCTKRRVTISSDLVVLPSHSGRLRSLRNRWFSACTKAGKLFGDIGGRLPNQHMESRWLFFICLPAPFTSNVIFKCSTTLPHITTPDLEYKHSFRQLQPQLWDKPVSQPVERSYQRSTSDLMQQSRHSCKVAAIFPTQCIHANSTNISQPFEMGHWCNLTIWFSAEFFITRSTVAFWQLSCCCIQLIQVCGTVLVHPQDYSLIRMIRIFKSHLSPISFSAHRPTRKMPPTKSAKTACFWGTIFSSGNWRPHWSHSMVGSLSKTSPSTGGHLVGDMLLWRTGLRSGRPHNVAIRRHYNRATRCRQKQQAKDNCNNIWRHRIRLWFPRAYCIYLRVHWTTRKKSLMRGTTWLTANSASIHHVCLSPGTWPSFANSFEVVKVVSNSKRLEFHKLHIFFNLWPILSLQNLQIFKTGHLSLGWPVAWDSILEGKSPKLASCGASESFLLGGWCSSKWESSPNIAWSIFFFALSASKGRSP